jgi:hypothetical protein
MPNLDAIALERKSTMIFYVIAMEPPALSRLEKLPR